MIDGTVVIDGVVHGYNSPPESFAHPVISELVVESLYRGSPRSFSTRLAICSAGNPVIVSSAAADTALVDIGSFVVEPELSS